MINRRNVLIGIGTGVAAGGAAIGTGAFSQVEATRDVQVNIIDDGNLADEFVDITLKASDFDSVGLEDEDDGDDISIIANDVTIVFGPDGNRLPPETTVEYTDLFEIENADGSPEFNVEFEVNGTDSTFNFDPSSVDVDGDDEENVSLKLETEDEGESGTLEITISEASED